MPEIKGHCVCGLVSYESSAAEPAFTGVCHCTNCQRQTGSAFSLVLAVPTDSLSVHGATKTFVGKGDSGKSLTRRFCPECGTSITEDAEVMPHLTMLLGGTLDDRSWLKPTMQIYCDSAQPWVSLGGDLKSFPKMPG